MRYGYFMMPMHPPGSDIGVTLQTDLAQIDRLDGLDFDEAWIGEHFTAEWENIAAPDIFIGAALQRTRRPIAVAGVTEKSETLGLAGERGWIPMSINFVTPRVLNSHWDSIAAGAARSGRVPNREE